jgi:DnaD/phage-associated family protein
MAWIESHQSLATHRKLLTAASMLHCDKYKLMGHLHALWYWALDNAEDGDLSSVDDGVIAIASGWPLRRSAEFVGVLTTVCFIDPNPRRLHDWGDYAGKLVDRRKRNRERMRGARAPSVQDTCKATVPNRTEPYPTVQNHTEPDRTTTTTAEFGEFCSVYEQEVGALTPMMGQQLGELSQEYPLVWFKRAVAEALRANVRRLNYVEAILKRWRVEGLDSEETEEDNGQDAIARLRAAHPDAFARGG